MKQKMINEMFNRIKKGPTRADMTILSKKHFSEAGKYNSKMYKDGCRPNEITVFHWYKHDYNIEYHDYENGNHGLIAEGFKSWNAAFNWLINYLVENDF